MRLKKIAIGLLSVSMMLSVGCSSQAEKNSATKETKETEEIQSSIDGFNGYLWGETYDDIINDLKSKSVEYYEGSDCIMPITSRSMTFYFDDNGIFERGAFYPFKDKDFSGYSDYYYYYKDYMDIVDKYNKKYGDGKQFEIWKKNTYKGEERKQGDAIYNGDLEIQTYWVDENNNAICISILCYEAMNVQTNVREPSLNLYIEYMSKEYCDKHNIFEEIDNLENQTEDLSGI